jgi:hypothetical protein
MATTTNYGWTTPDDTDLVKDGAAAIRTLGSSVDTTTKALNPSTTEGDIEYRSATADTNARLAIGTAGQVLTVNSGEDAPEWAAAPITSGPAFSARANTQQNISISVDTKVTFGTEDFDTAGDFASSRFTPTTAGYYSISASVTMSTDTSNYQEVNLYKNGSVYAKFTSVSSQANITSSGSVILYLDGSSDYVEVYAKLAGTNPRINGGTGQTVFSGVWIRS